MKLAPGTKFIGLCLLITLVPAGVAPACQITFSERVLSPPDATNLLLHVEAEDVRALNGHMGLEIDMAEPLTAVDVAANFDFSTGSVVWQFAELGMETVPRLHDVAGTSGGYLDTVGATQVAWLPREDFVLPAGQDGLILVRPADRQRLARWLATKDRQPVADYLSSSAKLARNDALVWLALDASGAISPTAMRDVLASIKILEADESVVDKMASLLSGLQGVRLEVVASDVAGSEGLQAEVWFDFKTPPKALEIAGQVVIEEVLRQRGLSLPNGNRWTSRVELNSFRLSGPIEGVDVDRLLRLFQLDSRSNTPRRSVEETVARSDTVTESALVGLVNDVEAVDSAEYVESESVGLSATRVYFDSITRIIERVRKYRAGSSGSRARWNEKMAIQIDELSTLNVDNECADYGARVAALLRGSTDTIRQANIKAAKDKTEAAASGASTDNIAAIYRFGVSQGWPGYGWPGYGYRRSGYGYLNGLTRSRIRNLGWNGYPYGSYGSNGRYGVNGRYRGYGGYGYGWPGFAFGGVEYRNYYNTRRKLAYDRNIDQQALATGYTSFHEAMSRIQNETGQMRRRLTTKYRIDF